MSTITPSLDDIQERSPKRNHRPTVWGVWGTDQAINAGLALSSYARLALLGTLKQGVPSSIVMEVNELLEQTVIDLCRGQYLDLRFEQVWGPDSFPTVDEYLEMVMLKTGVLLGTACEIGAIAAGAAEKRRPARRFGEAIGVAFQLQDDILGVWGDPRVTGKTASDIASRKKTLPIILAMMQDPEAMAPLYEAQEMNARTVKEVLALLETLDIRSPVGRLLSNQGEQALETLKELELSPTWRPTFVKLVAYLLERGS